MEERREYPRYSVGQQYYCELINSKGESYYGRVDDISQYGARIEFSNEYYPAEVQNGDKVYLYGYRSGASRDGEKLAAKAVWRDKQCYGVQFYTSVYESAESLMSMYPDAMPKYY
ncbi:PilZ domain-containing protein [Desulfovibrio subterraneus]|jgi:hypothetical protein|uniref:PilZ domain-containing protein n=1 Tax=Desulfovibrio subterraneus TaxID=2718620 RepID=A0A7J0BMP7_9BACT|nr:PilZ domain-containing protein [Desulfovibrio subterraneus]WBF66099.1 PilZ domain-containing protein [Desulfovibrio subterraneus]GFM35043.1 hypothetical protein DSM101010T_34080 [Desulfovibrio subterraneus]